MEEEQESNRPTGYAFGSRDPGLPYADDSLVSPPLLRDTRVTALEPNKSQVLADAMSTNMTKDGLSLVIAPETLFPDTTKWPPNDLEHDALYCTNTESPIEFLSSRHAGVLAFLQNQSRSSFLPQTRADLHFDHVRFAYCQDTYEAAQQSAFASSVIYKPIRIRKCGNKNDSIIPENEGKSPMSGVENDSFTITYNPSPRTRAERDDVQATRNLDSKISPTPDSTEAELPLQGLPLREEVPLLHVANSYMHAEDHQPIPTCSKSLRADFESDREMALTVQSSSDGGSPPPQETCSEDDVGCEISIAVSAKKCILESLMNEFNITFLGNASDRVRCQSERSDSSSSSGAANHSKSSGKPPHHSPSMSSGVKRDQKRDLPSEDEDDEKQKRQKRSLLALPATARTRLLACPFHKFEPKIYGPCNEGQDMAQKFRTCAGPGWPTVARLKEHLYRVHLTPIQCARCCLTMKTEKELEKHARAQVPCLVQPQLVQWVPREKVDILKDHKNAFRGQNEEERWKSVYGVLFPEDPSPPSPYYDDLKPHSRDDKPQSPSSHDLAAFEQYSQENLPRRVREAFEAMLDQQFLPIEETLKRALPEVVRTCQTQIFRDWERLNSEVCCDTNEQYSQRNPITDRATSQTISGEPLLFGLTSRNESLSKFYVEPEPVPIDSMSQNPVPFNEKGQGPSQPITDSGYDSVNQNPDIIHHPNSSESSMPLATAATANPCTFKADLEDLGVADLDLLPNFDWGEFLSDH